jgi:hypothetical protein
MRHRRTIVVVLLAVCALLLGSAARPPAVRAAAYSNTYLLRERLCLLQAYIERYANQHYSYYPTLAMVRPDGPLPAPLWPLNPWTGRAMKAGGSVGDYTYTPAANMLSYRLEARAPGGTLVLTGAVPRTRKMQADHRTREGLELVQQYIEMWARAHDDTYPPVAAVHEAGSVGQQAGIVYWPHNPWGHNPMAQSTEWGDFTYRVSAARDSYAITAHYSRGSTFTLRGATATSPWHRLRLALKDQILKRELDIVDGLVRSYAVANAGALPAAEELSPAGAVGQTSPRWPSDPYSGEPFTLGSGRGHFSYDPAADGKSYVLSATLGGAGSSYTIDEMVHSGIQAILRGVEHYMASNEGLCPPPGEVSASGVVGACVEPWPANPWVMGMLMAESPARGDFTYALTASGFTLSGHLADGTDFTANESWVHQSLGGAGFTIPRL